MTQEDKELLLKDLCARLQYGVKGEVYAEVSDGEYDMNGEMIFYDAPFDVILDGINVSTEEIHVVAIGNEDTVEFIEIQQTDGVPYTIYDFKPYLRPMSSMTEEQKKEWRLLMIRDLYGILYHTIDSFDYIYKNHIDFRGLISMGLAIDATNLNIY